MYNVTHLSVRHDSFVCLSLLVARAIFVLGKSFSTTKFSFAQKISARTLQKGLEVYRSTSLPPCRKTWKTLHDVGQHNLKGCGTGRQNRENGPKLGKICRRKYTPSAARPLVAEIDPRICKGIIWTYMSLSLAYTHMYTYVCLCVRM